MMTCDPVVVGVYVTEQLTDGPVPASVHAVVEKDPVFVCVHVMVPVGVLVDPGELSVIVDVQVEA